MSGGVKVVKRGSGDARGCQEVSWSIWGVRGCQRLSGGVRGGVGYQEMSRGLSGLSGDGVSRLPRGCQG